AAALRSGLAVIGSVARAAITVSQDGVRPAGSAVAATPSGDVFVRLEGVVDFEAERQRLRKEIERARKEITFLEGKLNRPEFVARAPRWSSGSASGSPSSARPSRSSPRVSRPSGRGEPAAMEFAVHALDATD